jgi:hypothetical protein
MTTMIPDQLGDVAELNARRTAAAAVLGDYKTALASAPLTSPPGREWMVRLASVLEDLLDVLGDEDQADEDDEDLEPYCYTCGANIGIFTGRGGDWLHYTGEGTVDSPVELYDPGHPAEVAWCPAGAR